MKIDDVRFVNYAEILKGLKYDYFLFLKSNTMALVLSTYRNNFHSKE